MSHIEGLHKKRESQLPKRPEECVKREYFVKFLSSSLVSLFHDALSALRINYCAFCWRKFGTGKLPLLTNEGYSIVDANKGSEKSASELSSSSETPP
mmetsp:Transcript_6247/g.7057  ORF Transcript_6247/g.7057 Transcript_6247/m.7057 type:complete len:97 (-) Transcript_6247:709-999(-)